MVVHTIIFSGFIAGRKQIFEYLVKVCEKAKYPQHQKRVLQLNTFGIAVYYSAVVYKYTILLYSKRMSLIWGVTAKAVSSSLVEVWQVLCRVLVYFYGHR